jgi:WD40 repeat protein
LDATDKFIFTGSEDGLVYVYDLLTSTVILKLSGHTRTVISLDYRKGKLVSGSSDGIMCIWSNLDANAITDSFSKENDL